MAPLSIHNCIENPRGRDAGGSRRRRTGPLRGADAPRRPCRPSPHAPLIRDVPLIPGRRRPDPQARRRVGRKHNQVRDPEGKDEPARVGPEAVRGGGGGRTARGFRAAQALGNLESTTERRLGRERRPVSQPGAQLARPAAGISQPRGHARAPRARGRDRAAQQADRGLDRREGPGDASEAGDHAVPAHAQVHRRVLRESGVQRDIIRTICAAATAG